MNEAFPIQTLPGAIQPSTGQLRVAAEGPAQASRMFSLDVLRGLAIALVLVLHFPPTDLRGSSVLEPVVQWLGSVGWIGVDLFFVLSGFLISGLIFKEYDRTGGFRPGRFWLRRGLKIWPSYFAAYGLMTVARISWEYLRSEPQQAAFLAKQAVCNSLFLQNYLACARWSHSWSLAVEEHFYTVFALLAGVACAYAARRQRPGSRAFLFLVPMFLLIAVGALLLRARVLFPDYLFHGGIAYYQSHLRSDSLFFGVLLGYLLHYHADLGVRSLRWPLVLPAFALAFLWPTIWPRGATPLAELWGFTLIYLSFGIVVASAGRNPAFGADTPVLSRWLFRPLAKLGLYSYTVYLAHAVLFGFPGAQSVRAWSLARLEMALGPEFALWSDRLGFLVLAIGGGVLLSHAVERPFLRLRERVLPAKPGLPVAAVTE